MDRAVKIPDATHPITVRPTGSRVTVRVGGVTVAESDSALASTSRLRASPPTVSAISRPTPGSVHVTAARPSSDVAVT